MPPGIVNDALRKHQTLSVRGDKHGAFETLFVDVNELQALDTPDWQVVYGRRGSGKTILLGAYEERLARHPRQFASLPLRLSLETVRVEAPFGEFTPEQKALAYFETFLEHLGDELATATEQLEDGRDTETEPRRRPNFIRRLLGGGQDDSGEAERVTAEVAELVRLIVTAVRSGPLRSGYSQTVVEQRDEEQENTTTEKGANAGVTISPSALPGASVGVSVGRRTVGEDSQVTRRVVTGSPVAQLHTVRQNLVKIVNALELERVVVLIDDLSALLPIDAQPFFCDYLHRAFGGTDQICVKLATDRYHTRLSDGPRHGLELGADIFVGVNLDRVTLDWPEHVAFYEKLLFRRLLFKETRLTAYCDESGGPVSGFIESIFEERSGFEEIVRGAQDIPRDFLVIFNQISQFHQASVEPRWTLDAVRRAVREYSVANSEEFKHGTRASHLLTAQIKPIVMAESLLLFTVPRGREDDVAVPLRELLAKHVIHEVPAVVVPGDVRSEYLVFQISYGLWLDWEPARLVLNNGSPAAADATTLTLPLAARLSIA